MATEIERKVGVLQDISLTLSDKLREVETLRAQAKREIDGDGLTLETCVAMSELMFSSEDDARRLYTGLLSVHQSMAAFVPEGMNEASKKWPP